tara:strand:+ start:85 stop:522 length:438 start_codon:yes stop_codon:yes gene_type:complete
MNITQKESEIIEEFALFDDWMDKYEHIIQLGKELPLLPEQEKEDQLLIKGCQSKVWVKPYLAGKSLAFKADSDAIITKGIIALLLRVINEEDPVVIAAYNFDFTEKIGLHSHLSPTRSNGLVSMISQIKNYALAYQLKLKASENG